ncbi:MAG: ATP-dependent RNA helicase HrpA [Nocardioidaceae bacterium]
MPVDTSELRRRLSTVMLRDEHRLRRRIDGTRKTRDPEKRRRALEQVAAEVERAESRVAARVAARPEVTYPEELPISQRRDDIAAAIRDHQVVIVAGETGSGKTTQLPKICLELGRGVRGLVGHTQPRRLAARTVADRIAEELDVPLGEAVGFQVRFTDQVGDDTLVKLMTDGILLAEIQRDPMLRRYDTLIIDEAHERSLNVDFLLGYLRRLLPRRRDLKVVITSATIDPQRFAAHFDDAPVVEVSGRTYPVEVRYRPPERDSDQTQAIIDAVHELGAAGSGDILVFLSGEREIRDTADALNALDLRDTEVLPLYARLSAADQHRVFRSHRGRRIVLATNVAETSLTVPGIRYVIDPGTARISRFSNRTKVQRLPIEPVSQASANQRKGRCGRTSDGICIRLYSEEDFLGRPEFTEPEILRTSLASVILQMAALGLGDLAEFPFVDPPDQRQVKDGLQLLHELGAMDPEATDPRKRLTPVGRQLAQLPVDPRLARMLVEADRLGCLREVMVIVAGLSIQDPRERPLEQQQAADQKHRRFAEPDSDFLALLNLWRFLRTQQKELSSNQFRKLCRADFLSYLRVREWQDVHAQLRQLIRPLGLTLNSSDAEPQRIATALLSGLLSHVGMYEPARREYVGARNARFAIFPGSALARKPPAWVMAAELVETSRLFARTVARIDPAWVEGQAEHLLRRTYSEPHWEKKRAAVMAFERVTLYGLPVVAQRSVTYGRVDPAVSRELFIRHALVEGDWDTHHRFFHHNRELLAEVDELEERSRRRDIRVDDEDLIAFYDQRLPPDVVSGAHFDAWWKRARHDQPDLLTFDPADLVQPTSGEVDVDAFPDEWRSGDLTFPLSYVFDPGASVDGITVDVPLARLADLDPAGFEWQVPGHRLELVTELIRSLPKQLRRHFIPAPDHAREVLSRLDPGEASLLDGVSRELRAMTGVEVTRDAWRPDKLPPHLRLTFRVVDDGDTVLGEGGDLAELTTRLLPKTQARISQAASGLERTGLTDWTIGTLPTTFESSHEGQPVVGHPALVDEGRSVGVRVLPSPDDQAQAMRLGTRRLLLLAVASPLPAVVKRLDNRAKLALSAYPHGGIGPLLDDCLTASVDQLVEQHGGPAWDEAGFVRLRDDVRAGLHDTFDGALAQVQQILALAVRLESSVGDRTDPLHDDVGAQLDALVGPGFVTAAGVARLPHVLRYLRAVEHRLDKAPYDLARDSASMAVVHGLEDRLLELREQAVRPTELQRLDEPRWMIEELRVSLFAQRLGTAHPVSEKRVQRALDAAVHP